MLFFYICRLPLYLLFFAKTPFHRHTKKQNKYAGTFHITGFYTYFCNQLIIKNNF
ncbi:hypothetical protein M099_3443 [Phocaeicola vulgatus str. 3975 RP4]|uniref:Uncharacterized protein n=1 Tax=Phocaeicola vulgatus str. 3975 RP4 TaxID=1339352 RepID=A0A069S8N9_PHOVU|nr:hypothetical protein M099_3443 [Phocaeicola vulgatus str. 3975 RP4]